MATIPIRISVDYSSVASATQGIQSAFARAASSVSRTSGRAVSDSISNFTRLANSVRTSFSSALGNVRKAIGLIGRAIGVLSFGELISDIVRLNNEFIGLTNTLISVEGISGNVGRQINFIRNEANRLGLPIASLGKQFSQLNAAATGTTLEGEGVRDIFSSVAETSRILQLSTDDTAGALRAIQQVISKGVVQSEELRGQLGERLPGAFNIAARAMDLTTQGLEDLIKTGDLMADDFLPKFANELRKTFGKALPDAVKTAASEMARLKNSFSVISQEVSTKLDPAFAKLFRTMNESLIGIDVSKIASSFLSAISVVLNTFADAIDFVKNNPYASQGLLSVLILGPKGVFFALLGAALDKVKQVATVLGALVGSSTLNDTIGTLQAKFGAALKNAEQLQSVITSMEKGDTGFQTGGGEIFRGQEGDLERARAKYKEYRLEAFSTNEQLRILRGEVNAFQIDIAEQLETTTSTTDALRTYADAMAQSAKEVGQLTIAIVGGNDALLQQKYLVAEHVDLWRDFSDLMPELTDRMKEFETFEDIINRIDEASVGWFDSFSEELTNLVTTGKADFRGLALSILQDLIKMQIQAAITASVMSFLGSFGSIGTTAAGPTGAGATTMSGQFGGGSIGLAQGGVLSGGGLTAFAKGGVVDSPTLFPMAKGTGLMGEAGPEAVMPLSRDSDGNLGVSGGGGSGVTVVNILDPSLLTDYVNSFEGEKVIVNVISRNKEAVNNSLQG
jgi:tape measure domain-containing protein